MYRLRRTLVALLLIAAFVTPVSFSHESARAEADSPFAGEHVPDRLLIKFEDGVPPSEQARIHANANARFLREIEQIGLIVLEVAADELEIAYNKLANNPKVKYVEPDYIVHAEYDPSDPYYTDGTQWAPPKISWPVARTVQSFRWTSV